MLVSVFPKLLFYNYSVYLNNQMSHLCYFIKASLHQNSVPNSKFNVGVFLMQTIPALKVLGPRFTALEERV